MIWAIVENDIVVNTIFADEKFKSKYYPQAINITNTNVGVNWIYDSNNNIFIKPKPEVTNE